MGSPHGKSLQVGIWRRAGSDVAEIGEAGTVGWVMVSGVLRRWSKRVRGGGDDLGETADVPRPPTTRFPSISNSAPRKIGRVDDFSHLSQA